MNLLLKNATVYRGGQFRRENVSICEGRLALEHGDRFSKNQPVLDCTGLTLFHGFMDVHVHLREPGFFYKETIETGTRAAARGGYTSVCSMPNLNPTPDTMEHLEEQLCRIRETALVEVIPYGTITKGEKGEELADMEAMAPYVAGFSDDGKGVQSEEMMEAAMKKAHSLGKIIAAHCEDNALLRGGYIHDGEYAAAHGHRGICSESEWKPIERDLKLVVRTGCAYHVCHISTKESVALIRQSKAAGLNVTCETGPHYLTLSDRDLQEDGRFKMNPPLRSESDREALIEGLLDGTIDMIATDHAPHSAEEKSKGLAGSLMGVVGLETAFPVLYTDLVKTGILPLEKLLALMCDNPHRRFGGCAELKDGAAANLTLFDLNQTAVICPEDFVSMGKSSPFTGRTVSGVCKLTVAGGNIVWQQK